MYIQRIRVVPAEAGASASSSIHVRAARFATPLNILDRVAVTHGFRKTTPLPESSAAHAFAYYTQTNEREHTFIQIIASSAADGRLEIRTLEGWAVHPSSLTRDFSVALLTALREAVGDHNVEILSHWHD
jgi:hypothetical protein